MAKAAEQEPVADSVVPHWSVVAGLRRSNIEAIAGEYQLIDDQIKALEGRKKELKDQSLKLLVKADVKSVQAAGCLVTRVDGVSRHLSAELLLKAGVKTGVIEKSYKETHYSTVKFTAVKGKEEA